jgi:hypothetical protein
LLSTLACALAVPLLLFATAQLRNVRKVDVR